jgi:hypothetical protein
MENHGPCVLCDQSPKVLAGMGRKNESWSGGLGCVEGFRSLDVECLTPW